jgi:hypothetical protein
MSPSSTKLEFQPRIRGVLSVLFAKTQADLAEPKVWVKTRQPPNVQQERSAALLRQDGATVVVLRCAR